MVLSRYTPLVTLRSNQALLVSNRENLHWLLAPVKKNMEVHGKVSKGTYSMIMPDVASVLNNTKLGCFAVVH
jgi:hypothetical protein